MRYEKCKRTLTRRSVRSADLSIYTHKISAQIERERLGTASQSHCGDAPAMLRSLPVPSASWIEVSVVAWTGKIFMLRVRGDSTVDDVIAAVKSRGLALSLIRLTYDGAQLAESCTLASHIRKGVLLRADSEEVDALVARFCTATSIVELKELKPVSAAYAAQGDAIADARLDPTIVPVEPTPLLLRNRSECYPLVLPSSHSM